MRFRIDWNGEWLLRNADGTRPDFRYGEVVTADEYDRLKVERDALRAACAAVAAYAKDSLNCGVCNDDVSHHYPGCPVPAVEAALALSDS